MKSLFFRVMVLLLTFSVLVSATPNQSTSANLLDNGATPNDLDGDGRSDLVIWRQSTGDWFALLSRQQYDRNQRFTRRWGNGATDVPLLGDLDGDSREDLVVWRTTSGYWYVLLSRNAYSRRASFVRRWGNGDTDVPLLGDLDGDGRDDIVVWRTTTSTWYALLSRNGYSRSGSFTRQWGGGTDIPLLGDLDGDGRDDLIVWRATTGTWYALLSRNSYNRSARFTRRWGDGETDVPVLGDLDGDSRDDIIVWRKTTGTWYALLSRNGYSRSASFTRRWGHGVRDEPQLGLDVDGDGRLDPTVWRRSDGRWWILKSRNQFNRTVSFSAQWGNSWSDVTIPYESLYHRVRAIGLTTFLSVEFVTSPESTYLPWPGGHTWQVLQGGHGGGGYSYDFDPNGGQSVLVESVRSGRVMKIVNGIPDDIIFCKGFSGNAVVIKHDGSDDQDEGLFSTYWHLKRGTIRVREGDWVDRGDIIAERGWSGYAQDARGRPANIPHLHFAMLSAWHPHTQQDCGGRSWSSVGGYSTPVHFDDDDPDLRDGIPVQGTELTSSNSPLTSGCSDSAEFVGQSRYPTVGPGQGFQIYFEVRNTGTCTWRMSNDYYLGNINGTTLGANSRQELGGDVSPGATKRWTIDMTAPNNPGTYRTQWMVKHGSRQFGPNMYIDVTVRGSSVFDDFSSHSPGQPPGGWTEFGTTSVRPTVEEVGGSGPASRVLRFPSLGGQYVNKWLIKDGASFSRPKATVKLNFRTSGDRAGLTLAWRDSSSQIVVHPNVYWDNIEFWETVDGQVRTRTGTARSSIPIEVGQSYWLKAVASSSNQVSVYWSTDGVSFREVLRVNVARVSGQTGVGTAGPNLPLVDFDNFHVEEAP